jgi:sec-independent protein translocase protein TatC
MAVTEDGLAAETGQQDLGLGRRANPDARMPLMEHIRELRSRVIKVAVAVAIGTIIGWIVYEHVWHFIEAPYCRIPQPASIFHGKSCQLFVTGLFDALFLRMQISIATGVILAAPVWLYQFWAFIAPGLYRRERHWAYYFVGAAVPLFAIGATLSYFAMSRGVHFLLDMLPAGTTAIITINTYLSYASAMLLIFGIAFEVPLVFVLLNMAGVLTHERFRKWRRSIIFLVFVFAAVATPSPDPISMLLLAVPCVALVEATEIFAYVHDRRKAAREGSLQFPGMTDAEVAAYGLDKPLGEPTEAGTGAGSPPASG